MVRRFLLILSISLLLGAFQTASAQKKNVRQKTKKPVIVSCSHCIGKAIYLAKPKYPLIAKYLPRGEVSVEVVIDEKGNVESAKAITGHPFFHVEAIKAALKSKFEPFKLSGKSVRMRTIIVYKFVP